MTQRLPELLSPAGSEDALHAAVDCGANAVYLGYTAFGARASAVNFDAEALEQAVRYAHLHHTRIYVTVNTLIKPGETEGVREALRVIQACGADAVIVQDPGVAAMAAKDFPGLRLHASTQMALCSAFGVDAARALGFDRVVLARECSLDEIRKACATGTEIEVFCHGALCTAVSGRCLMSSMSGGRSGNRGRCAQPCRQCFRMQEANGPLLSQRDLCVMDDLPALCEAGVASLKIEGRLKSPEYVAVVTSAYRKALDELARGTFRPGDASRREDLLQIYNRGGFTRGHVGGAEDAALITPERVSHEGLPMGEVLSVGRDLADVLVRRDLHNGDTLQLRGRTEDDVRYSGPDVPSGGTARLRLRPGLRVQPGTAVFRLSDAVQLEAARAHQPKPIPVTLNGTFAVGKPMELHLSDGSCEVTVPGPDVQPAVNRASAEADAVKQLEKLGGTAFAAHAVRADVADGAFLPVSALNALRRDGVTALENERIRAFALPPRTYREPVFPARPACEAVTADTVAVLFSDVSLAQKLADAGASMLIWSPADCTPDAFARDLTALPDGAWLRLPPQLSQADADALVPVILPHAEKLSGIVAESISQFGLIPSLPMLAGEGVPVTNPEGMRLIRHMGACGFVLWPEWTYAEQRALTPFAMPALLKVYGRETLMLLNHCPRRAELGLTDDRAACTLCKDRSMVCGQYDAAMTDRKNYRFPLTRTRFARGCEIAVLGALPTDLRAHDGDRRTLGAGMLLHFTAEPPEEQLRLTALFAALSRGEAVPAPQVTSTPGHWVRGVE